MVVNHWESNKNFWKEHPELRFIEAFETLRKLDKTDEHNVSSKEMWAIAMIYEVDKTNKIRNLPLRDRIDMIEKDFLKKPGHFEKHKERLNPSIIMYKRLNTDAPAYQMARWQDDMELIDRHITSILEGSPTLTQIETALDLRIKTAKMFEQLPKIRKAVEEREAVAENRGGTKSSFLENLSTKK